MFDGGGLKSVSRLCCATTKGEQRSGMVERASGNTGVPGIYLGGRAGYPVLPVGCLALIDDVAVSLNSLKVLQPFLRAITFGGSTVSFSGHFKG